MHDSSGYFLSRLPEDPRRAQLWSVLWHAYFRFLIRPQDVVLDLGAGYCSFINVVHARVRIAVDQWPGFRAHAATGVEAHVGSVTDLEWLPDASVDFAFASNLFEHISHQDLSKLLAQLRTKLSPAGRLCLVQPNYRYCSKLYFDDYTHVTVFSHVSLQDFLLANRFRTVECKPRFLPLTLKSRFPVHPLLIRAYLASPLKPFGQQMLILAEPLRDDGGRSAEPV